MATVYLVTPTGLVLRCGSLCEFVDSNREIRMCRVRTVEAGGAELELVDRPRARSRWFRGAQLCRIQARGSGS